MLTQESNFELYCHHYDDVGLFRRSKMGYGTDGIHDEVAYSNAIRRNIIGNAHKTWLTVLSH